MNVKGINRFKESLLLISFLLLLSCFSKHPFRFSSAQPGNRTIEAGILKCGKATVSEKTQFGTAIKKVVAHPVFILTHSKTTAHHFCKKFTLQPAACNRHYFPVKSIASRELYYHLFSIKDDGDRIS